MKLTFDTKMDGMEKVVSSINELNKGMESINGAAAKLSQNLNDLVQTFDVAGKSIHKFIDQQHINMIKNYSGEVTKLKQETSSLQSNANTYEQQRKLAESGGNFATAEMFRQMRDKAGWQEPPLPPGAFPIGRDGRGGGGGGTGGGDSGFLSNLPSGTKMMGGIGAVLAGYTKWSDALIDTRHGRVMSERQLDLMEIDPSLLMMKKHGYDEFSRKRGEKYGVDYAEKGTYIAGAAAGGFMMGGPVPALVAALIAAIASPDVQTIANRRTKEQAEKGKDMFADRLNPGRAIIDEQGALLGATESQFGSSLTANRTVRLGLAGMTPAMYAGVSNAYAKQGMKMPSGMERAQWDYGIGDASMAQNARRGVGSLSDTFKLYNAAGISGDFAARQTFGDISAQTMAATGTAISESSAMASRANMAGMMGGDNKVENMKVADQAQSFLENKLKGSDNIQGFNLRSALLSLGIEAAQIPMIIRDYAGRPAALVDLVTDLTKGRFTRAQVSAKITRALNMANESIEKATGLDKSTQAIYAKHGTTNSIGAIQGGSPTMTQRKGGENDNQAAINAYSDTAAGKISDNATAPAPLDTLPRTQEEARAAGVKLSLEQAGKDTNTRVDEGMDTAIDRITTSVYTATIEGFKTVQKTVESAMKAHEGEMDRKRSIQDDKNKFEDVYKGKNRMKTNPDDAT